MADVTVASRQDVSLGNLRMVVAELTAPANAQTWPTGLGTVLYANVVDTVSGTTVGATMSAGTVTLAMSTTGTGACKAMAIGY